MVALPLLMACFVVLRNTGKVQLTGDLFIAVAVGLVLATAVTDQGLFSRVLVWFVTLPLLANFIGYRLRVFQVIGILASGLVGLLVSHYLGWLTPLDAEGEMAGRMMATIGAMVFTGAIAYQYEDSRLLAESARARLEMERRNWMSIVSHELRTPLTAIHGALSLLDGGAIELGGKQSGAIVAMARKNTQRLIDLTNAVLDVEKLEHGPCH
ncbi:histidine kinase dimerization/phospho-acceptor domain-containing protein [Marinobacter caseinilyticus]|uniref:histidine kinase dimerization/phospho-acceptor domain-containing protein n=1 Tax=Marinobacter caseinilyticus TaxID=2692195 RepID=UPI001F3EF987|nr:histidine kinase dimerization/phospho-acceptor domain-containing protein [Marinobacter caseinilyticus]